MIIKRVFQLATGAIAVLSVCLLYMMMLDGQTAAMFGPAGCGVAAGALFGQLGAMCGDPARRCLPCS